MSSSTSHKIKARTTGNDVFITPRKLAKLHIDMIPEKYKEATWLDPCKNDGSYYDQFPEMCDKEYCEILEDKDFFDWESSCSGPQVIISNPPYSILDAWLQHTLFNKPDCFSYLIGQGALTTRRMEWIEDAGYTITRLHLTKVYKWYGMSYIVVCVKGQDLPQKITKDRTIWREDPKPEPIEDVVKTLNIKLKITIHKKKFDDKKINLSGNNLQEMSDLSIPNISHDLLQWFKQGNEIIESNYFYSVDSEDDEDEWPGSNATDSDWYDAIIIRLKEGLTDGDLKIEDIIDEHNLCETLASELRDLSTIDSHLA